MVKKDGYLVIGTTIHDKESSGMLIKQDYSQKLERYRYQYTKKSFEQLIIQNNLNIIDRQITPEKKRDKTWYNLICQKY